MKIKYTPKYLTNLEAIFTQAGYTLRYEKGNFKSGYCVLNTQKIVIVNQYYSLEGKINSLILILQQVDWNFDMLRENERKLYIEIISSKNKQLEIDLDN